MAFQGFSNDNAPEAFGAMVRRQGAAPSGFGRPQPGMGQKPGDITPPGPNHSREWFGGGGQELTKGGERSFMPTGKGPGGFVPPGPLGGGYGGSGINPGGMYTGGGEILGGPYGPGRLNPAGGYPPADPDPYTPLGQMDPKHPMGPDPYSRAGMFGGFQGPGLPIGTPVADPRYPRNQPGMTRQMWQQNRLGGGPQIPVENPIQPTDDWLGRSNGAPQGWNWSR